MNNEREYKTTDRQKAVEAFEKLNEWFENEHWSCFVSIDPNNLRIITDSVGKYAEHKVILHVDEASGFIDLWALLGIKVQDTKRTKVLDFIAHANNGSTTVHLELYYWHKVAAKTSISFTNEDLTDFQIDEAIGRICSHIQTCAPPLLAVMFGSIEPVEAAKGISGD